MKQKSLILIFIFLLNACSIDMGKIYDFNPLNNNCLDKYNPLKRPPHKGYAHLVKRYKDIPLVDVHSHDSAFFFFPYLEKWRSLKIWEKYGVDYVAISGNISEPAAVQSDKMSYDIYKKHPERFFPNFAGFDINNESCLAVIRNNLEHGYFGIGEFVAASSNSPVASKLIWKGEHPMSGYFPEVYKIIAEYKAPILMHIDPWHAPLISKLEKALESNPDTTIILAHGNAFSDPGFLEYLLKRHDNLYIDYLPGFDLFDKRSRYSLEDYVPIIEKYKQRFLVSTDSGFGIGYENAYLAIYALFDLLKRETVHDIAHRNYLELINRQPMTQWQRRTIQEILTTEKHLHVDYSDFNKRKAGEWIWSHK